MTGCYNPHCLDIRETTRDTVTGTCYSIKTKNLKLFKNIYICIISLRLKEYGLKETLFFNFFIFCYHYQTLSHICYVYQALSHICYVYQALPHICYVYQALSHICYVYQALSHICYIYQA